MVSQYCIGIVGLLLAAGPSAPESGVKAVPPDWTAAPLRTLAVESTAASSTFDPASGHYVPSNAVDGNRRSKWVASAEPSERSPQWITLRLADGEQTVSGVAVFGEAVNNDGIIDGQIQVAEASAGQYRTMATIKDARSASWLATFPPVKTTAIRLLITKSGGPSPNTDVYEIEVLGLPMTPEETERRAKEARHKAEEQRAERRAVLSAAREAATKAGAATKTASRRDAGLVRLFNDAVILTLNEANGAWDVVWSRDVEAAVQHASFSVELDAKTFRPGTSDTQAERFTDRLGSGMQIRQTWDDAAHIERCLRVYDGLAAVTVSGRITNTGKQELSLGTTRMVDVSEAAKGRWWAGGTSVTPAAVFINGISELLCEPAGDARSGPAVRTYRGTGILALTGREPTTGMAFGYLTALEAQPDLAASFRVAEGGTSLTAELRFLGRKLGPGESIDLDTVYLSTHDNPYVALEKYGDAAAALAQQPIRKGPNSLWCSWYAHRMAMTEELVLANAEVAARHFKPLGMDVIQLDHGWQRGDITGDWVANERFPHGLKWLSDDLKTRYGFKLGVWIAPTDVADTSEMFREHRDLMLKGDDGRPLINWKWYWKPNPNCYELDASNPAAAKWIEDTFARLTASGVSYYKIDFIAASAGQHFRRYDPKCTPGWSVLRRAMEAIRRGAGPDAWIRYCQTPPLLSAGLADSAYGGSDTLDAGLGGKIDVLRTNARSLAAGYWINDRLYHREVCDMSVRMQGDIEETRMRLAMMTLAGCSISFSDEFQYLPPSRIRMMQQCLPPGSPPMRPIDLFERTIPSIWHLHCRNAADEWDVVGLFNFEDRPEERTVEFAALGLPADAEMLVFEFWEERFLGLRRKGITLTLPPQTSRVVAIRRSTGRPQIVGTDMHLLQGYHEITKLAWDATSRSLSGEYRRMPGLTGRAFLYVPPRYQPHFDFPLAQTSARLTRVADCVWTHEASFASERSVWSMPFDEAK